MYCKTNENSKLELKIVKRYIPEQIHSNNFLQSLLLTCWVVPFSIEKQGRNELKSPWRSGAYNFAWPIKRESKNIHLIDFDPNGITTSSIPFKCNSYQAKWKSRYLLGTCTFLQTYACMHEQSDQILLRIHFACVSILLRIPFLSHIFAHNIDHNVHITLHMYIP